MTEKWMPAFGMVEKDLWAVTLSEAKGLLRLWHSGKQVLRCAQNDTHRTYSIVGLMSMTFSIATRTGA